MLGLSGELTQHVYHFNRGQGRIKALVASFEPGAVLGLLDSVAGQDAKDDRHLSIQRGLSNTSGCGGTNVIEVISFTTYDRTQANNRNVLSTIGKPPRHYGDFKGTWYADHVNVGICNTVAEERLGCSLYKQIDNGVIEPRRHHSESPAWGMEVTFDDLRHGRFNSGSCC
jgi:hypothetical protein